MKILLTTDWNDSVINGVVMSIKNLKYGLEKLGHEVRVLALSDTLRSYKENDTYYAASMWMGYVYPKARARLELPIYPEYMAEIIEWCPDIVHSNCEISTYHIARHISRVTKAPMLHTYHTVYEYYFKYFPFFKPFPHLTRAYIRKRTRKIAKNSDIIIAPTKKVEDLLRSYKVKTNIEIIPSGIELSHFIEMAKKTDSVKMRKKLNIPKDCLLLAHVGRIAKEKNITELLGFMQKLKDLDDTILLIVGDGPFKAKLTGSVEKMGIASRVIFTGMIPQSELPDYYSAADLFVCASKSETQGLCYSEALSCGTPILCRKDPCLDGLLEEGINGWSYETERDFFEKLDLYKNMPQKDKEKMSEKSIESVEKHSVDGFARAVEAAYYRVLQREHPDCRDISA